MSWLSGVWADQDLRKYAIAPTVAILIFVITNVIQMIITYRTRKREIKRIVVGIYTEIAHNLKYGTRFISNPTVIELIKDRLLEDEAKSVAADVTPTYRPLVAITESSKFYDAIASTVPDIRADCVVAISLYYRSVMDQQRTVGAIESYSFLYITVNSRRETIDQLWQAFLESVESGKKALGCLESRYPRRWFREIKP